MGNKYIVGENIDIKLVEENQIDVVMIFQQKIIDKMEKKEWFIPTTKEDFLKSIYQNNLYFCMNESEIIGLLVLLYDIEDELKKYKLPDDSYMLIEGIMVKDEYRGHGLQKQMLKFAYERANKLNFNYLVATVHPDNIYSLNNFVSENYNLLHTLTFNNTIRHIITKKVSE